MSEVGVVGVDVGGANLKAATPDGRVAHRPFALWRHPDRLAAELAAALETLPRPRRLAVTMTGELCDCYATKREGVGRILDAAEEVAAGRPVFVWGTDRDLVPLEVARRDPLRAAAANWLALAEFAGRFAPIGSGLLIDVGSTTTDIVPLVDGRPAPAGLTDLGRLQSGELVYVGVRRTPACALMGPEGAAELFATTADVMCVLGEMKESTGDHDTADGRPLTRECSHARLARMVGADAETLDRRHTSELAHILHGRMIDWVAAGVSAVVGRAGRPPSTVILSGAGEPLARAAWSRHLADSPGVEPPLSVVSLMSQCGREFSRAAPAAALAIIAAGRLTDDDM